MGDAFNKIIDPIGVMKDPRKAVDPLGLLSPKGGGGGAQPPILPPDGGKGVAPVPGSATASVVSSLNPGGFPGASSLGGGTFPGASPLSAGGSNPMELLKKLGLI